MKILFRTRAFVFGLLIDMALKQHSNHRSLDYSWARGKRGAYTGETVRMKPEADGRKGDAVHAIASPTGRIAAIGGEARGSAHGTLPAKRESVRVGHTLP